MENSIYELWPTPIYHTNVTMSTVWEHRIIHNDWVKMKSGNGSITESKNLLYSTVNNEKDEFNMLTQAILEHTHKFLKEYFKIDNKFKITTSWGVMTEPGEHAGDDYHFHANSVLSAVYYFKRIENCGGISFRRNPYMNPVTVPTIEFGHTEETQSNSEFVNFEPNTGDLIIFPSHLYHKVLTNNSKRNRYSIACNLFPTGDVGLGERVLSI